MSPAIVGTAIGTRGVMQRGRSKLLGTLLAAGATLGALALLAPEVFSIHLPFIYREDGLSHALLVKSVLEIGWFPTYNPRLGAPFGATWFDYPLSDAANLMLVKLVGALSGDWIVVTNIFFLAGFVLCAVTAFLVMEALGLRFGWAIVGATLYAVLPYHFLRPHHLFLIAYWSVPLGVYLAMACGPQTGGVALPRPTLRNTVFALLAIALGSGGIYYAFFAAVLIAIAGIFNVAVQRSWRGAMPALLVLAVIAATVAANLAPTLRYWQANGRNEQIGERQPEEAEYLALKPIQLLLPQPRHRLSAARSIADVYRASAPLVNENSTSALGFVGTVGFLLLLLHGLRRILTQRAPDALLDPLAWLAVIALSLGTIGGLGSIFAYAGFTSIRAYNRISVFIAFIALTGFLLIVQRGLDHISAKRHRLWASIAAISILSIGLLDQIPARPMRVSTPSFASDRAFFAALERALPPATAVFQLPYHPYPEAGPVNAMDDYGLVRGYLSTDALRWSYGAMKGRAEDAWLRAVSRYPLAQQLDIVGQSGFGALYVDRRAYADHGRAIEAVLRERLGPALLSSEDGELVVWRVAATGSQPVPLDRVLASFAQPIELGSTDTPSYVERMEGFIGAETWGRWMLGQAKVRLWRPLPSHFVLRLDIATALQPVVGQPARVKAGDVERSFSVPSGAATLEIPFAVPPGTRSLEFFVSNPVSPRDLGISEDARKFGIGVQRITIVPDSERGS